MLSTLRLISPQRIRHFQTAAPGRVLRRLADWPKQQMERRAADWLLRIMRPLIRLTSTLKRMSVRITTTKSDNGTWAIFLLLPSFLHLVLLVGLLMVHSADVFFFSKKFPSSSLREMPFCMALVERLGNDSRSVICAACCYNYGVGKQAK